MKQRVSILTLTLGLIIFSGGCGEGELVGGANADAGYYYQGPIVIWNLSLFPQLEIYAHPYLYTYKDYEDSPGDLLEGEPLEDQAITVIQFSQFHHITAVREQVSGGPKMILTTAVGLNIYDPYHVLMIFRDGFRLLNKSEAEQIGSFPGWPEEITSWQQEPWP